MECIRDKDGNVIRRSRNLAGIRRYVGGLRPPIVVKLCVDDLAEQGAKLSMLFDDGSNYETNFASFQVLKEFVRRWKNVHGAPLLVNGKEAGFVGGANPI